MFKKFSIVMFATALSFSCVAGSSSAYGQCSCVPGASAAGASAAPAPAMTVPSTQSSADGYRRFSYDPSSTQALRAAPVNGSASMFRAVPYYGNQVNSYSRSKTPLYLLSKPERNSGRR